ncbi:MAG: peptidoglycan DD-metalloendopeptidase family protein [Sulfurovaceae bacterium]|nr:peptidoglycan DD-metalloendopeptidase family protein [Sulfurovaceae bacterium]MDD5549287.1 peptidoglycan DD-metalloendopeptidase family protein [Sulfurovaceae bacterium]
MIRILLILVIVSFANCKTTNNKKQYTKTSSTTLKKIKQSTLAIKQTNNNALVIKRKLESTKQDINKAKNEIKLIDGKLTKLSKDYVFTEEEYKQISKEVEMYEIALRKVSEDLEKKHNALIILSAEQLSLSVAIKQVGDATKGSIISGEFYEKQKLFNQKKIANLENEILKLDKIKKQRLTNARNAQNTLIFIKKQRQTFTIQKTNQEKEIIALNRQEEKYKKDLDSITKRQDELRSTLVKLNILRANEVAQAEKRAKEQREAIALEVARKKKLRDEIAKAKEIEKKTGKKVDISKLASSKQSDSVKNINSSYQAITTSNYSGGKTISPIAGASVIKRFGTYEDPVYKIKIFNESITLQAPSADSPVVSVMDGKVVYAGNSSMLGKVVVIAHAGNLHTVYAGLSKIPSTITVGRAVSKGYTIGKVSRRLIFEATKNSRQIDPLQLIKI